MLVSPDKGSAPHCGGGVCERGEFFPIAASPFGYNETLAQEYFPLSKDDAIKHCYKRQDHEYPINVPKNIATIRRNDLVGHPDMYSDDILSKAIICDVSGKPFRIMKQELAFYRANALQIPTKHPDIRHFERMRLRNPRKLWKRTCTEC